MSGFDEVINPLINRDRWQRPIVIDLDGVEGPYQRCTTFIDVLDNKWNLQRWGERKIIEGLCFRDDLRLDAASFGREPTKLIKNSMERWVKNPDHKRWNDGLNAVADQAKEAAEHKAAATRGQALHRFCERMNRGETLENVPIDFVPHIAAYEFATQRIEMIKIETFMVLDDLRVAGTPDRIVSLPGKPKPMIFDIKTGDVEWGQLKMSMQMAIYAHSKIYDPETNERTEIDLDQETAIICALDQLTAEVVLLEIYIERGWEACHTARDVWAKRSWKSLTKPLRIGDNLVSREVEKANRTRAFAGVKKLDTGADLALITAIREADTEDELRAIFKAVHPLAWTDDHTDHAKRRKAEILAALAFAGTES
jgi:hypothetical protein